MNETGQENLELARAAMAGIVDRLVEQSPTAATQFAEVFNGEEAGDLWIGHLLTERGDELIGVVGEVAIEQLSDDDRAALVKWEAAIAELYAESPELAAVPVETVRDWLLGDAA